MLVSSFTGRIGNDPDQKVRTNQDGSLWVPLTVAESIVVFNSEQGEHIQSNFWSITTILPPGTPETEIPRRGDQVLLIGITIYQKRDADKGESHTNMTADYMRITKRSTKNAGQQRQRDVDADPWTSGAGRDVPPPF